MIEKYINFYKENLANSVIPFWLKNSPDWEFGGHFTCLEEDGSIYDTRKYIWLQGRCLWMFSRLYCDFEERTEFFDLAASTADFIDKYASDENGDYYFSVTREGKPFARQVDLYGKVFCMLGYLEYSKISGRSVYFDKSKALFNDIIDSVKKIRQAKDGVCSGVPAMSTLSDQMVLADMSMELYEVENKQEYLDIMQEVLSNILMHYVPDKNILLENISLDGTDITKWPEGRFCSPGHSVEVAWFILHLLKFIPDNSVNGLAHDIIEGTLEYGWDWEYGGLCNSIDIENKSDILIESYTKLWWPHAEAIYAVLCAYKEDDDPKWLYWLKKLHNYVADHFIDEDGGGWYGFCDRYGNLINSAKGSHSKGFFHVPRMLLYSSQLFDDNC